MEPLTQQRRLYEMDLFRFLAALSIVIFHYAFRGYAADSYTIMPCLWLAPIAKKYGYLGVNLFFMISGFVVLMTASGSSARRFAVSRAARLYPAFWVCCTLTFIAILVAGGTRFSASFHQYAINMTMLSGFLGVPSMDGVYWAVFVEIKFYALVAAVLLLGQMHRAKLLLGLWLALAVCISLLPIRFAGFFLLADYAPYFIAGAMCYFVHAEGISVYKVLVIVASVTFLKCIVV